MDLPWISLLFSAVRSRCGSGSILSRLVHATLDSNGDAAGIRLFRGDRESCESGAVLEYCPGKKRRDFIPPLQLPMELHRLPSGCRWRTSKEQIEFLLSTHFSDFSHQLVDYLFEHSPVNSELNFIQRFEWLPNEYLWASQSLSITRENSTRRRSESRRRRPI